MKKRIWPFVLLFFSKMPVNFFIFEYSLKKHSIKHILVGWCLICSPVRKNEFQEIFKAKFTDIRAGLFILFLVFWLLDMNRSANKRNICRFRTVSFDGFTIDFVFQDSLRSDRHLCSA